MESAENREQPIQVNQQNEESNDSPSLSKVETLKLLNDSIDQLEETIKGINENSSGDLPSSASINDLLATTQELANTVAPESKLEPESEPNKTKTPSTAKPGIKQASISQPPATPISQTTKPPSAIPQPKETEVNQPKPKQNKTVLISIGVFAIAMAVVALFWIWYPKYQASLTSIAEPSVEIVADNDVSIPEIIKTSESESVDIEPVDITTTEVADLELETPTEIPIPQDLTSPGKTKNLKVVTIKPELTFTPEQNLVAALQAKIADITQGYPTDFVDSIKVNLAKNTILVEVNDHWYDLNESRQSKIGNEILERSRQLKFSKLKFQDSTGTLVARNPAIGDNIIIIKSDTDGLIESDTDGLIESDTDGLIESDTDGLIESDTDGLIESDTDELIESDTDGLIESDIDGLIESDKVEPDKDESDKDESDKVEVVELDKDVIIKLDKDEIVESGKDVIIKLDKDDEQSANDS